LRPCSRNIGSWEEKASSGSTQGECEIVPLAAVETGKPLPLPSCQSVVLVQRSAAAQTPPACQSASLSAPFCALLIPSLAACRSAAFQASFPAPKGGDLPQPSAARSGTVLLPLGVFPPLGRPPVGQPGGGVRPVPRANSHCSSAELGQ